MLNGVIAVECTCATRTTRSRGRLMTMLPSATAGATTPAFAAKTYVSGKNPDGPREKGDTKGTKKDGSYLPVWNPNLMSRSC